jgi:hypothetical protein
MMVVFVDQRNADSRIRKSARGFQARKSCADNNDMGEMICVHSLPLSIVINFTIIIPKTILFVKIVTNRYKK